MPDIRSFVAKSIVVSLLISPAGPSAGWQPVTAAAERSAAPARAVAPADGGWPRAYTAPSGARIVLYQPQIALWPEQKHMTLGAAVSYLASGAQAPALGTLKIEADTKVALADRLVSFSDFKITQAHFETVPKDQLGGVIDDIKDAIPREQRVIGLDRVLAMVDSSAVRVQNVAGVKADPPVIFYSDTPAALVNFDGDPIWSPIDGNDLKFAVNTNWDVFTDGAGKTFFLRVNDSWLAADAIKGPWRAAGRLPDSFSKLPQDSNWNDVRAALPGKPLPAANRPVVYVSTTPAELIEIKGPPQYMRVSGTKLLWVSNTESDIFRLGEHGPIFFLVSGRWFSAPEFGGPWTFVTPTLPEDFKHIPLDHPRSRVLASVPGTRQAVEAVLLAEIPQTARVNRKELQAPDVAYQGGAPQFEAIANTMVERAVNTDKSILKVGDRYYLCFQGVWFTSTTADGPWSVADSVPKAVYDIPISSPAHDVTYVTVESSDEEWVEFASAAAYSGMMVAWGCAMWGSGWYYPPYYWGGGYYPAYFGYYPTYGYGASYNPWTGAYTRGGAVYGPYGGAGYAARYNPRTGTYSRGAAAYGPGGARGAAQAWNPATGTAAATRQGRNVYGSWGSTAVQRGDQWAATSRFTSNRTGTTTRGTAGSGGGGAITRNAPGVGNISGVGKTGSGDVYAGRDGNVYRKQADGSWQRFDGGGWNTVERPSQRPEGTSGRLDGDRAGTLDKDVRDQLNRDRAQRLDGGQRTKDLGKINRGGFDRGGGSYRPGGGFGGGGFRGGGGGGFRGGGGRGRR